jgi:MFS family permease
VGGRAVSIDIDVDRRVLVLAIARFADAVGNSFLIVVLPLLIASGSVTGDAFGLSPAFVTGLILSLYGFLNSLGQPFTGRLSDRTGDRKRFVLIGLAILVVANLAYAFAGSYVSLLVVRALQGVGVAFTIPSTLALVNEFATDDTRGGSIGLFNTFRMLGVGLGPIAAGVLVDAGPYSLSAVGVSTTVSGFDAAFYFAACTATLALVLVLVLIHDPEIEPGVDDDDSGGFAVFDRSGKHVLDPVFALGVVSFFMAIGIAVFATLGSIVNPRLDQGPEMFGLQFAAFVLAQIFLQAPIGRATDFYGRKRFIVLGMALLVPTTAVQGVVLDPWLMCGARFAQGVAGAMVFAPALALAGDLAGKGESGSTLSVLTMAFGFGVAFGPLLSGFLVEFGFHVPFTFAASLAAVGLVLVYTQVDEVRTPSRSPTPADD